ncbi:MAG: hypothetical protein FWC73_07565 [Defluviitaleaceae bacterium]|nr:hypothetical protein [Defluviitaleaceae bacterium]
MSRTLKACRSLFIIRVTENLQYRAAGIANSSISIIWSILQIVIFTIFFTLGDATGAAMTLTQAITYAWLTQILWSIVGYFTVDAEIREKVINGNVALDLCRPLDLYAHWFSKTMANKIGRSAWRSAFTLIAAVGVPAALRLSPPVSIEGFLLFLISLCTGALLCVAFAMLMAAVRVGLTWGEGPTYMLESVGMFLNGNYFPLALWPDFMQGFLLFQPFAGLMDIPFRFYLGLLAPSDAFWVIGLQIFWVVAFIAAGRFLLNRKISHLIVQGG